jgi:hypothetical protein
MRATAYRIFFTCWILYALHFATNTVREIFPALTLGDHMSFDVSEYAGLHPDIFSISGRGSFINNNPGASILGAIPYLLARPIIDRLVAWVQAYRQATGIEAPDYDSIYPMAREFYKQAYNRGLDIKFGLAAVVMQVFLMAPLTALSVVVMYYSLFKMIANERASIWLSLLYGFATPVFYRVAQLNHNLLQALFAFFAFILLWQPGKTGVAPRNWQVLLAGLLAGWTVLLDYSGVIILIALGIYAFMKQREVSSRTKLGTVWFISGSLVGLLILFSYQWFAFGNPILPAQHYMPVTTYSGLGYQGIDLPRLDLIWENLFGVRFGLFLAAPIFLTIFLIPLWAPAKRRIIGSLETWFIISFFVAFLLFTSANQFSRMQFNSGIRHMLPVVPFLFFLTATVLLNLPRWLSILIGILTTYWSWCLAMFRDVEQGSGIFEAIIQVSSAGLRLPWLTTLNGLGIAADWITPAGILFIAGLVIGIIWIIPAKRTQALVSRPLGE